MEWAPGELGAPVRVGVTFDFKSAATFVKRLDEKIDRGIDFRLYKWQKINSLLTA